MTLITASTSRPVINLDGTEENALVLMDQFQKSAKQLGRSEDYIKGVIEEMKSGEYNDVVIVFDREVGQFFDLIVPKQVEGKRDDKVLEKIDNMIFADRDSLRHITNPDERAVVEQSLTDLQKIRAVLVELMSASGKDK